MSPQAGWILKDEIAPRIEDPDFTFARDGLLVEFAPRKRLEKSSLDLFKQIGFKPLRDSEKHQVWTLFQSIRPGIYPAPLTTDEAALLLADLGKTRNLVSWVKQDPKMRRNEHAVVAFYPSDHKFTGPLKTQDIERRKLTLGPEIWPESIKLTRKEIKELKALPMDENFSLELDCLYSPGMVAGNPQPYFPWLALAVDGRTGKILDLLMTDSRTEPAEREAARGFRCLVRTIRKVGLRPREVGVRTDGMTGRDLVHL